MRGAPALVVLCGCRGILGIHGLADGPPDTAPPDGTSPDGAGDGVPDVPAGICPADFIQLPGGSPHVYRLASGPAIFNSQLDNCAALSIAAYLAIPDDQPELDGLVGLAATSIWVGIDDLQTEGTYRTVIGQVATFLPFAVSEPDGTPLQNCLFADDQSQLHDQSCSSNLPAICECEP